jgi:hypothetical protein
MKQGDVGGYVAYVAELRKHKKFHSENLEGRYQLEGRMLV